jgi:hypothetical protein
MKGLRVWGMLGLWTVLGAVGAGCGGDEDTTATFLGEWQFTSGTTNTKCPAIGVDQNDQLTGDKYRISKGIDSPLVYSEVGTSCNWKMTVNGNVANVMTGQSCTDTRDGVTYMAMYTAGTLTVSGTTAQYSGSLTATANVNGSVINCMSTGSGGMMKVAQ